MTGQSYAHYAVIVGVFLGMFIAVRTGNKVLGVLMGIVITVLGILLICLLENALRRKSDVFGRGQQYKRGTESGKSERKTTEKPTDGMGAPSGRDADLEKREEDRR